MFSCTTEISCDMCGAGYISQGNRMSDCISRDCFRYFRKKDGWKVVYGKYDICDKCIQHYGMKYIRSKFKEREQE